MSEPIVIIGAGMGGLAMLMRGASWPGPGMGSGPVTVRLRQTTMVADPVPDSVNVHGMPDVGGGRMGAGQGGGYTTFTRTSLRRVGAAARRSCR